LKQLVFSLFSAGTHRDLKCSPTLQKMSAHRATILSFFQLQVVHWLTSGNPFYSWDILAWHASRCQWEQLSCIHDDTKSPIFLHF